MRTKLFSLAATMLLLSASVFAQTLGDVAGSVNDQQGAPVAGANISITNAGTNSARTTITNGEGLYAFPALVPGSYSVKVDKAGFKT